MNLVTKSLALSYHQHDVRAKQAKACDAERAGFQAPAHASAYLSTDRQLIVQGRIAYDNPSLMANLTVVSRPSMNCRQSLCVFSEGNMLDFKKNVPRQNHFFVFFFAGKNKRRAVYLPGFCFVSFLLLALYQEICHNFSAFRIGKPPS